MKLLLPYLKDYWKESWLAPLLKMAEAILELFVPLIVAHIIDNIIPLQDTSLLFKFLLYLFALAAMGLVASLSAQYFSAKSAVGVTKELSNDLFEKIMALDKTHQDHYSSSTLVTRMSNDTYQVQTALNLFFRLFLRSPFIVFGSLVMAWRIDRQMALYFVVMIIALFIVVGGISYLSVPLNNKVRSALDHLVALTREQIHGARVIRAFARQEDEIDQFEEGTADLKQRQLSVNNLSILTQPLTYVIVNTLLIVVLWQGGHFVYNGHLTQGALIALTNYLLQILVELVKLTMVIMTMNRGLISLRRIDQIMQTPIEDQALSVDDTLDANSLVAIDHMSFTYPKAALPALENIDLTIRPGEYIGVIGGTGSGKTTLTQLISAVYEPTKGRIAYQTKNFDLTNKDTLRASMAVVPQQANLFQGTIRSNLKMAKANASDKEMWQALEHAQAKEFVEKLPKGLDAPVATFGRNYSGGQRQRLTVARALLRNVPLVILDDSTSALDYLTEANLIQALRTHYPETAMMMISQRAFSIQEADQILVLDNGQQVGLGRHEELVKECQIYREIVESQEVKEVDQDGTN